MKDNTLQILLIGYYGKGNFGDDVLFQVTYGMTRQRYPDAEITVQCDQYKTDYLYKLAGEEVKIVASGHRGHYDLIIHGGGGTFFDFKNHGMTDWIINILIQIIGLDLYYFLEGFIRIILGKKRTSTSKRLGIGIGVGTYTKSSKKLKHNILVLMEFDRLIVRDTESVKNLEKLGIKKNVKLGTDLAFLYDFWVPQNLDSKHLKSEKKKVGVILRDWYDNAYLYHLKNVMDSLKEVYELSVFVFDKRTDLETMNIFKDYPMYIWEPIEMTIAQYSQKLAEHDVLITSRAHGAMCGAILGVPSIIIEIEPKLKTIHSLLSDSSQLLSLDKIYSFDIKKSIEKLLLIDRTIMDGEIKKNHTLIKDLADYIFNEDGHNV